MADVGQSCGQHTQAAEGTGDGSQSKPGQPCMDSMACLCTSSVWEASHLHAANIAFLRSAGIAPDMQSISFRYFAL